MERQLDPQTGDVLRLIDGVYVLVTSATPWLVTLLRDDGSTMSVPLLTISPPGDGGGTMRAGFWSSYTRCSEIVYQVCPPAVVVWPEEPVEAAAAQASYLQKMMVEHRMRMVLNVLAAGPPRPGRHLFVFKTELVDRSLDSLSICFSNWTNLLELKCVYGWDLKRESWEVGIKFPSTLSGPGREQRCYLSELAEVTDADEADSDSPQGRAVWCRVDAPDSHSTWFHCCTLKDGNEDWRPTMKKPTYAPLPRCPPPY